MLSLIRRLQGLTGDDRGVTALIIAGSMFMIAGFTAIAIDASALFVERRADQTAVDLGAVAGGLEILVAASAGGSASLDLDMVNATLDYVRFNLPTQYNDTEWQALWEGCVDPASERNAGGYNFVALDPPSGWTVDDPANWCISRDDQNSLYRVRTPDQVIDTTFANVLGFNSLQTSAVAVVEIIPRGAGILPFGFPDGLGDGVMHCLSDAPGGLANNPCDGPQAGNFGTLKIKRFTPSPYQGCQAAPTNSVLALNIATGIDHVLLPLEDHDVTDEEKDICYNYPVNTLQTDPGFPTGTEAGLVTGSGLPSGEIALLQQGPQPKQEAFGDDLDNQPLWNWLLADVDDGGPVDYGGGTTSSTSDDAPIYCDPAGFTTPYDIDGDGSIEDDEKATWQHMQRCLTDYVSGGYETVIFSGELGDRDGDNWSPRFAYVPQFWDTSLGPGISQWLHIQRFRAIFVQGIWWTQGKGPVAQSVIFHPGETCNPCTGGPGYLMSQVTAFIIPDDALPEQLRGDPPPEGLISPYVVRIYR